MYTNVCFSSAVIPPKKQLTLFGFYQSYTRTSNSAALFDSLMAIKGSTGVVSGLELGSLMSSSIRFKTRNRRFPITQYKIETVLYQYGLRLSKRLRELIEIELAQALIEEFNKLDKKDKTVCLEHLIYCGFISDEEFITGTF